MTHKVGDLFSLEPIKKSLRPFDDMKGLALALKRNVKAWSWGAVPGEWVNIDNYALRFKVHGHHFTGHVILVVNSHDYFDLYFTKTPLMKIKDVITDVCIDELVEVIDKKVEYISAYGDL